MRTIVICPSTALVVVIVIVSVAAESLVTLLTLNVTGTVAAFELAVMSLSTSIMLLNLFCAVHV